ncbi:hypothetical protein D3H65_10650 [Paraflavitalea soli]|uniref:YD repeat-containing protein n=2 Tax=Paraflavitalea soli TaxID=2315862 RepID=A0A3B7ML55_9BACT|nr:hypothetical protein D3H65_10650 [Paraflavitalea soli]
MSGYRSFSQNILGKTVLDYSSKAPEVQQIQKFIDVPVSFFNGTPNINIPVHTVTSKSISIPLSLEYHAGGIKAEDDERYVGLGWAFKGAGSITRTVRGNEDEGIQYESRPSRYYDTTLHRIAYKWISMRDSMAAIRHIYGGYYVDNGSLDLGYSTLSQEFTTHNQDLLTGNVPKGLDLSMPYYSLGLSDPEPDLFYFEFGGYSGKFIFGNYGTPILIPHTQDLQITPLLNIRIDARNGFGPYLDTSVLVTQYFESFKISTPDGKDYYFGESSESRIKTPYTAKMNMFNAWYLTRIIDRNTMDTAYFEYNGSGIGSAIRVLDNKQKFDNPSGNLYDGCVNTTPLSQYSTQTNYTTTLKSIKTAKEEIQFFGGLDSIKVMDRSTGLAYKKLQFDYAKFSSGRKKLVSYAVKDLSNNQFYPYTFNYYDIPGYKGRASQDYWGFYNGASNNNKLMIGYPGCIDSAANRAPAWPAMKLDILTEITYPTGGKSIFEYEPHTANTGRKLDNSIVSDDAYFVYVGPGQSFVLTSNLIGGLRIKSIQSYDPIKNDTLTKKFYYNVFGSGASSGHLAIPPSLAIDVSSFACNSSFAGGRPTYLMSTHNLYGGSGTGSHVTYRNVTVQEEKNGINNGRIEYEYYDDTNTDSAFYSNAISDSTNFALSHSYDVFPDWQYKRLPENFLAGNEKTKRIYNAGGVLLQKETTFYGSRIANGSYNPVINAIQKRDICGTPPPVGYYGSAGPGSPSDMLKYVGVGVDTTTGDTEKEAFDEEQIAGLVSPPRPSRPMLPPYQSYYFFYRTYISNTFVYKSKTINESYETTSGFSTDTTTYFYETNAHINPTSVITRSSKEKILKQQNLYAFDFNDVNNGDSTIYFMKKAFLNLPVAGFSYTNSNITAGAYRHYKLKSRQDSTIVLPFEEYALNNNTTGITETTLNLGGAYPKTLNLPLTNFQKQTTFYYNPDNTVSHIIKKGNDKIAVLWDYNRLFAVAQALNADSADIAFSGFEASGNGNWNIGSPLRTTNSFLTGKKAYNLSNGNITKTGLNTAKSYIVSYWSASSAAIVNSVTPTTGITKKGWTYYEHKLPAGATSVTISGTVIIDELRLYPVDAQMSTYSFEPLLGVTSINSINNSIAYYEYDGAGQIRFVKDADGNILKIYDYFYTGFGADTAAWRSAGTNTRIKPCDANSAYNTDTIQVQQVDINPNSPTYGTFRWVYNSKCVSCVLSDWQNTATPLRCVKDGSNQNTGQQEQEQRDMNPCSNTYNQTKWVAAGTNTTACPIPPPPCTGLDKMMINGVCVTGIKVYTATGFNQTLQKWSCTYHYEFLPDCIKGPDYTEYNTLPCTTNNGCIPD